MSPEPWWKKWLPALSIAAPVAGALLTIAHSWISENETLISSLQHKVTIQEQAVKDLQHQVDRECPIK